MRVRPEAPPEAQAGLRPQARHLHRPRPEKFSSEAKDSHLPGRQEFLGPVQGQWGRAARAEGRGAWIGGMQGTQTETEMQAGAGLQTDETEPVPGDMPVHMQGGDGAAEEAEGREEQEGMQLQ